LVAQPLAVDVGLDLTPQGLHADGLIAVVEFLLSFKLALSFLLGESGKELLLL
jgi:hypothetical protein